MTKINNDIKNIIRNCSSTGFDINEPFDTLKCIQDITNYVNNIINPPFERLDLISLGYIKVSENCYKLDIGRLKIWITVHEFNTKNILKIEVTPYSTDLSSEHRVISTIVVHNIIINSIQEFNTLIKQLNLN